MRKKKEIKVYKQAVVNAVILAVILGLFLYFGVQLSRSFSVSVSTQRTQIVTDSEYVYLDGYIFRDEIPVAKAQNGVVDYRLENGAKIGVGSAYVDFYALPDRSESDCKKIEEQLRSLTEQLRRLQSKHTDHGTVSDLAHIDGVISRSYYAYIDAISNGDLTGAHKNGETLLSALVDYTVVTGKDGVAADITAGLEQKKADLLSSLGVSAKTLYADKSCYFFYETDGYENIFDSALLEGLTYNGLLALAEKEPMESSNLMGKKILTPEWQLVLPVEGADAARFEEGKVYEIGFRDAGGQIIDMVLEKIYADEQGSYLQFCCFDLSAASDFARTQSVKILMEKKNGYKIPSDSLAELNGEKGVYILIGTVVEFRRVTVIGEGNGYYLVKTYEKEMAALEEAGIENGTPYLYINDLIITSGTDLYDGKHLD